MEPERIELSQRERDRLKVRHEVENGHLTQVEAVRRVLSENKVPGLALEGLVERDHGQPGSLRESRKIGVSPILWGGAR